MLALDLRRAFPSPAEMPGGKHAALRWDRRIFWRFGRSGGGSSQKRFSLAASDHHKKEAANQGGLLDLARKFLPAVLTTETLHSGKVLFRGQRRHELHGAAASWTSGHVIHASLTTYKNLYKS